VTDVEVLRDPTPAQVRETLRTLSGRAGVGHDLELAVTEVVANAREHGRPPVEVRLTVVGGDVEVEVCDGGPGPVDRHAPSPPPVEADRGRGRWLAHHLADVEERWLPSGSVVRLRAATAGGTEQAEG
jgi:anti-sigma regulatory factor (Ser/Thr protein kinase)